jgi:hypothetical protein
MAYAKANSPLLTNHSPGEINDPIKACLPLNDWSEVKSPDLFNVLGLLDSTQVAPLTHGFYLHPSPAYRRLLDSGPIWDPAALHRPPLLALRHGSLALKKTMKDSGTRSRG